MDDIRAAVIALRRVKSLETIQALLTQFGVKNIGEIDPALFPDVLTAVEKAHA
jgi:hypothetical protein